MSYPRHLRRSCRRKGPNSHWDTYQQTRLRCPHPGPRLQHWHRQSFLESKKLSNPTESITMFYKSPTKITYHIQKIILCFQMKPIKHSSSPHKPLSEFSNSVNKGYDQDPHKYDRPAYFVANAHI